MKKNFFESISCSSSKLRNVTLVMVLLLATSMFAKSGNISGNCYRGYVEVGYDCATIDPDFNYCHQIEISTTHGYQANPFLFIGGGVGFHFTNSYEKNLSSGTIYEERDSKTDIPVYADLRINLNKTSAAPFVEGKCGYYVNNDGELYYSISAGFRFSTTDKEAFYFSVGYASSKLKFYQIEDIDEGVRGKRMEEVSHITVRVGYEF